MTKAKAIKKAKSLHHMYRDGDGTWILSSYDRFRKMNRETRCSNYYILRRSLTTLRVREALRELNYHALDTLLVRDIVEGEGRMEDRLNKAIEALNKKEVKPGESAKLINKYVKEKWDANN